jgi:hypothetical protein
MWPFGVRRHHERGAGASACMVARRAYDSEGVRTEGTGGTCGDEAIPLRCLVLGGPDAACLACRDPCLSQPPPDWQVRRQYSRIEVFVGLAP